MQVVRIHQQGGPEVIHYIATRDDLLWRSGDLFAWIQAGKLKVGIERSYSLHEAGIAQRDLASRMTSGKLLLEPPGMEP